MVNTSSEMYCFPLSVHMKGLIVTDLGSFSKGSYVFVNVKRSPIPEPRLLKSFGEVPRSSINSYSMRKKPSTLYFSGIASTISLISCPGFPLSSTTRRVVTGVISILLIARRILSKDFVSLGVMTRLSADSLVTGK
jgi:hypothetical protein